jgi:hypothetical protein
MRLVALFASLCLLAVAPRVARGDAEGGSPTVEPVAAAEATPGAVPLEVGEQAPFDGVLLPEAMLLNYLRLQADLAEANWRIEVRDRALEQLESDLAQAKTRASKPRPGFWLGVAVGVGATVGLIWATAKAIDAASN